jgi:hypothetical protein
LAPEPAFHSAVSEHVEWKISIALFAALIIAGLKPLFNLVGFFGDLYNEFMRFSAMKHALQSFPN